jgi:hypothetical protein
MGVRYTKHEIRDQLKIERLRGEGDGRLFGRIDERRLIARWLRAQGAEGIHLSDMIDRGVHALDPAFQQEGS